MKKWTPSKILGAILVFVVIVSMLAALSSSVASASKFNVGDSVEVTTNLNVRTGPGTGYPEITDPDYPGYAPTGTQGKVLDRPASADGYIWWKVDFGPGLYSGWSVEGGLEKVVQKPSPPTITSPGSSSSPGPEIDTLTPTLQWNAVSNADYYALAISIYPYGSSNIVYNPQQLTGTSHTVPSGVLEHDQKYRWNMQAHNSAGWSDVSNTLYFQTTVADVTLTLYVHEGSASGPVIPGARVTGQDGGGNSFDQTTNSSGYVTSTGTPGTWSFTVSKSGYETNSWSQSITATSTKHAYLVKQVQTPTVETRGATDVTQTAATLNGRIVSDGGSSIIGRRFDWGTTSSCSDGWTASASVSGSDFSYRLTGLNPGTTYYFRAWAKNSAGWSQGSVLSFTTQSLQPPPPPTPTSPGSSSPPGPTIDTRSPTFYWSDISGANYYGLYIRNLETNTLVFDSQARGIQITGTSYTLPSGVLEWGKPYRWNMNSHNSAGWGSYSGVLYFQTKEQVQPPPPPTPTSPGSSSQPGPVIDTLTPTLQWSASSGADYYALAISKYPYGSTNIVYNPQQLYGTSHIVPSGVLEHDQKYRWNMQAHNSAGWSDVSNTLYFQTPPPPEPPPDAAPSHISPSNGATDVLLTLTFRWSAVSGADYYGLYISEPPYGEAHLVYENESITGTSLTLPSGILGEGVTYHWNMSAGNDAGWGPFSSAWSFTTGTTLAAPSNLIVTPASSSEINLSWQDNSDNETGFKIERKTGAGGSYSQIDTVGPNVTTYPDTGLSENTTYYYRVRAYNDAGDSSHSNEASATTGTSVSDQVVYRFDPNNGYNGNSCWGVPPSGLPEYNGYHLPASEGYIAYEDEYDHLAAESGDGQGYYINSQWPNGGHWNWDGTYAIVGNGPMFPPGVENHGNGGPGLKILIYAPWSGRSCVAVIGDSGPAPWTGRQFGVSDKVFDALGLPQSYASGGQTFSRGNPNPGHAPNSNTDPADYPVIKYAGDPYWVEVSWADQSLPPGPVASTPSISPLEWPLAGRAEDRTIILGFGADWEWGHCGGLVKKHVGIDIVATKNEGVYAAEAGEVKAIVFTLDHPEWKYGVTIEHSGFTTVYWHLNPAVDVGDKITKGQKIGTIADLGADTHLHFGVRGAGYSDISNRGALPQMECGGAPAFPEYFIDPESITYTYIEPPIAHAGTDQSVSSGDPVSFDASNSYDPDGTIVSYGWDFGDGETATGRQATHRFRGAMDESKTYNATLTVEDDNGATATDTIEVVVVPLEKSVPVGSAGMTVWYNWVDEVNGEDVYIVSRISAWTLGLLGMTEFTITSGDSTVWRDVWILPKVHTETYLCPFTPSNEWWELELGSVFGVPPPITELTFPESGSEDIEIFEGIEVRASDRMNVLTRGLTPGVPTGVTPSMPSPNVDTASTAFDPDAPIETTTLFSPLEDAWNWIIGKLFSPGELRVYDSQGRVTGLVNGEVKEEIPYSVYNDSTIIILFPSDSYTYEVAGTDEGPYGLGVVFAVQGETNTFAAIDIPTTSGATHQYTIDWDALSQGKEGVSVQIDSDGDGTFEQTTIIQPPIASFTYLPEDPLVSEEITFDASESYDVDGGIVSYEWNFGDGNTSSGRVVTHTYSTPEDYAVTLTTVDDDGVLSTYSMSIQIGEREQGLPTWVWIALGLVVALAVGFMVWRRMATKQALKA